MTRLNRFLAAVLTVTVIMQPAVAFAQNEAEKAAEEAAVSEELPAPAETELPEEEDLPGENEDSAGEPVELTEEPPAGEEVPLGTEEAPAGEETLPAEAPQETIPQDPNFVRIVMNGVELKLDFYARAVKGVTYVAVKDFFEAMNCQVRVDDAAKKVFVSKGLELEAVFAYNDRLARANSRCWYMDQPCTLIDGVPVIPVRAAAKIFSCTVVWDGARRAVLLEGGKVLEAGKTYYDQEELLWLARIIYHEAGNQIMDGKVAVGNVVLNRKASAIFPGTVHDVIYDTRNGIQFITKSNTKIFREPPEACFVAAKLALEGYVTAPDCLFFTATWRAPTCWAQRHRKVYATIGDHVFYL